MLALASKAYSLRRVALFCEGENNIYTDKGDNVLPCYPGTVANPCTALNTAPFAAFQDFDGFERASTVLIKCDGNGQAGICEIENGTWTRKTSCNTGSEAVFTMVTDDQHRRLRSKTGRKGSRRVLGRHEQVEIDGETWTVVQEEDLED